MAKSGNTTAFNNFVTNIKQTKHLKHCSLLELLNFVRFATVENTWKVFQITIKC